MADKKPTEEQTNAPATEQTTEQANKPAAEKKKLDKKAIIAIAMAIISFLAILFGVLAACGVFNKNTPGDQTAKITITIEVNGGTGNYNDITFVSDGNYTYTFTDEEIAAIKEALKKDGYELKGLSTTPDGDGGWTITIPEDAESPLKIYAIWEKNEEPLPTVDKYTVTFNMHGHGTAPADITDAAALPAELPTVAADGYGFIGWYLDGEYNTAATAGATISSDTTLHARWAGIFTHEGGVITGLTEYGKTLSVITIPSTLDGEQITGIGGNAFKNNQTITGVTIPNTVTGIGTGAFIGCRGLTSIKIPDGVTSITYDVFSLCSSLTSIEIPSSLTNVGHGAFYGCPLTAVYFNGTGDEWNVSIDNSAASNGKFNTEIVYYYSESEPTVEGKFWHYVNKVPTVWETVPVEGAIFTHYGSTVTGLTAYGKALNLTEITVPDNLDGDEISGIGSYAFSGCTNLTSITISEGITSIGDYAFYNCTGLEGITIPEGLTSIGQRTFAKCTGLTSVTMLEGVKSIDYYAFSGCTSLTSIEIPVSLTSISYYVFYECTNLETVYYKGASSSDWNSINIAHNNSALTDATVYYYSEEPEVNADGTDLDCNYWHYVGGVPTIWTYADRVFTYSGNTVTGLTDYGKTLSTITIPNVIAGEGITGIDAQAFVYCANLTNVTLLNGIKSIGVSAFSMCHGLVSVTIPNSVISIGSAAFAYCENLTTVTLPDDITSVPYMTFAYCTSLESIIIPGSVTNIESSAFAMIDSLITVYFKDTSAKWDDIEIGGNNTALTNGTRYYYSGTPPTEEGNFWHDVAGMPTVWVVNIPPED